MTDNSNDRRRRPRSGFTPGSSGQGRPSNRPASSQSSQRSDAPRRGYPPDSGYRPGGNSPGSERNGSRGWDNQGGRPDNRQSGRRDYRGPQTSGNDRGPASGRPGNNHGSGPERYGNNQGPRNGNSQGWRNGNQGQPGSGNNPGQRGNYPARQGGTYRPNEAPGDRRNQGDRGRPYGQNQGRDRYGNSGRPAGGNYRGPGGGEAGRPRPNPGGQRDGAYRDPRALPPSRPPDARNQPAPRDAARPAAAPDPSRRSGKVDPFELFCAYHLGITTDKKFRHANINDVARRFGVGPGEIKQALQDFGMDAAVVMEKEFDMALAQLDIELAPEGVDRVELARQIYTDFLEAPRRKIDWKKIIEEDIRENAKIFGRKD